MNHVYQLVWSQARGQYVAASEHTRSQARRGRGATVVALCGLLAGLMGTMEASALDANTLPTAGTVTAGAATLSTSGTTLDVHQSTQRAAINWQSFSVGSNATVNFNQPNASAVTLNRVVGNEASVIAGALNANGQVFVLNSNGVLFAQGAQVNVGGIVASILNMSDADFMAGRSTFTSTGSRASVINMGTITTADGGYAALIGNQVKNQGVIVARLGTAAMAAGDKVSLNFNGNSLVGVAIEQGTLNALVENGNAIRADGGLVVLTAKGVDAVLGSLVNNTGEVRAQTVANKDGKIYLLGDMANGTVNVAGKLDASAPNGGNGGFIDTSAANVRVADEAVVTAAAPAGRSGTWLIDPTDFTIASGSGALTGSGIGATTLSSNLANANVTLQTQSTGAGNGDIFVNAAVSWSSANTLTLEAHRNINVNANITASHADAGVIFLYGQGSADGGSAAFNQANAATITAASQQWRKGSDLDGMRYAIVNGDVFLGGKFIELGINAAGYFGANGEGVNSDNFNDNSKFPSLFYGRQSNELGVGMTGAANGFANSYDKTTSTSTSQDLRVDYFLPGSPYESTAYGWDGVTKASICYYQCSSPQAPTVQLLPLGADNVLKAKVTSTRGDLTVEQLISFGKNDKYFNNAVTMQNTGTNTLADVVYARNFDPDNTKDINGNAAYRTIQRIDRTIAAGDKVTIVSATSSQGDVYSTRSGGQQTVIFFSTQDSRVSVGIDTDWNNYEFWGSNITAMTAQMAPQGKGTTTVGGPDSRPDGSFDGAMGLIFRAGSISAGASKNFNYNTVLAMGSVDEVLTQIPGLGGSTSAGSGGPRDGLIDAIRSTPVSPRELLLPRVPVTSEIAGGKAVGFSNVVDAPVGLTALFGPGTRLAVISSPRGDEPTQVVSISEASSMLKPAGEDQGDEGGGSGGDREVRVPASRGSLVDIVNGGVKLPTGVEQQLFVVKSN